MANYQVTISDAQLHELLKNERALPALIQDVLNQVLKAQATDYVGAEPYERTDGRRGYRNGYRERRLVTRVGSITLEVPQFRKGQLPTELFERYQRSEVALLSTLVEMVVCGVSTRKVTNITRELCGTEISKSTVSELTKNLDPLVRTWNERSLSGMQYPFLIIDAMCIKVRKDGRVRSQSVFVGTGVNEQGYREVLGLRIGDSESEASWGEFFSWLRKRGLSGVDLVVSDDHKGLVKAAQVHFQGASWQRCQTHFTRNILDVCPKAVEDDLHGRLRAMFDAPDMETARDMLSRIVEKYRSIAPKSVERLEDGFDDSMAVMALPAKIRKKLRTTNSAERLNQEIRRRERVIRIFPNEDSAVRLIGAVLAEIDEKWTTGKRYLDLREYYAVGQSENNSEARELMAARSTAA